MGPRFDLKGEQGLAPAQYCTVRRAATLCATGVVQNGDGNASC